MRKILSYDSVLVRLFNTVTNIMLVNILWILCSMPIVTMGAATTAAYYVFYHNITGEDEAVIKPFFKAFKQSFTQATLLWLPLLLIGVVLVLDVMFLLANYMNTFHVLWVATAVIGLLYLIVISHCFAIMGRFDAPIKLLIRNCLLIFLLNFIRSFAILLLTVTLPLVLIFMPRLVTDTLPLWLILMFGLSIYLNARMFLISFDKSAVKTDGMITEENGYDSI